MCGRFENNVRKGWMIEKFAEFNVELFFKNSDSELKKFNIAPTNQIITLKKSEQDLFADFDKWGIKFSSKSPLIFNSRIETISAKPFWKMLFDKNRCIVPMTAFYEWTGKKGSKISHRISLKDEELFFVPGLYNKDKDGNLQISLITTPPNKFMKPIHNRMPVILHLSEALGYLNDNAENNFEKCLPYKNSDNMQMDDVEL